MLASTVSRAHRLAAATAATTRIRTTTGSCQPHQPQQIRLKHSSTQIKRMFRQHPARIRVEARMGIDRTVSEMPPPAPKFPAIFEPQILPNGWSAPPPDTSDAAKKRPEYPFFVARTKDKPNNAVGFLPVYTKHRKDGTKVTTRIKKIQGDRDAFLQELRAALQIPLDEPVRVRTGGTVEIHGHRAHQVRQWLGGLGF